METPAVPGAIAASCQSAVAAGPAASRPLFGSFLLVIEDDPDI
jgi:hypothetical protein